MNQILRSRPSIFTLVFLCLCGYCAAQATARKDRRQYRWSPMTLTSIGPLLPDRVTTAWERHR